MVLDPSTDRREAEVVRPITPILQYLTTLHARLLDDRSGDVASYIPELARANPDDFGICIVTVDGQVYSVGDATTEFTIQSMSKPFLYGEALRRHGPERVLAQVGVEPTGEAFNAIVLDDVHNRPFNPMVNAGAIAIVDLLRSGNEGFDTPDMLALLSRLAGRPLSIDEAVFQSESVTGHRNRAIAYLMLNSGMIRGDPEDVVRLYFSQCSVKVTCTDMAMMAATLANAGCNPRTGERVFDPAQVRDVLTVMTTCGMYDNSGTWAYEVGLPAKSGVAGGIVAVMPGQAGVAVYSPLLDAVGNSVRGIGVCKALSREFSLHAFDDRTHVRGVIRREFRASEVGSKRLRSAEDLSVLRSEGSRIAVIETQGALFFGSAEVLIRRMAQLAEEAEVLIVDFRRASYADPSAVRLIQETARSTPQMGCRLLVTGLVADGALGRLRKALMEIGAATGIELADDLDRALESSEEALLRDRAGGGASKYALGQLEIFAGLSASELRLVEAEIGAFHFDAGAQIIRRGDPANALFVIVRGSAVISVEVEGGRRKRLGSIGPGYSIGEMAVVEGGVRTADAHAVGPVTCYSLSIERLHAIGALHPNVMITILRNLVGILGSRLRVANEEIRSLE